jgi:hypothetical protein
MKPLSPPPGLELVFDTLPIRRFFLAEGKSKIPCEFFGISEFSAPSDAPGLRI